jgi:hypothetical protein
LARMTNSELLESHFHEKFSESSFLEVFFFMDKILSIEKSTSFGIYYAKSVFSNLLMRVKLHLDWRVKKEGDQNSRNELLHFVDLMVAQDVYARIGREDFYEIVDQDLRARPKKRQRATKLAPVVGNRLHFPRAPPPKTAHRVLRGALNGDNDL